jgi:hypothetical protein
MINKIKFEYNGFVLKCISFNKKTNTLNVNKFDKMNNFITKDTIKIGQIPRIVKQKLNNLI